MKTYEEILKDENRFFNNWENYRLYKDGDTVIIDYPDEVCNNPTQEGQKKALRLLCKVYNEIKPYKEQIKADAKRIKEEREKRIIWDFRRIEECLNMFLEEYEAQILEENEYQRKVGHPKCSGNIEDYVPSTVKDKEDFLHRLRECMKGKTGKNACLYLFISTKFNHLTNAPYKAVSELVHMSESAYNTSKRNWLTKGYYSEEEKEAARNELFPQNG